MGLATKIIAPTVQHTATCIFFHGSGMSGEVLAQWVRLLLRRKMAFPHIKLIYPTAPNQPYTPLDGQLSNVWFDRPFISNAAPECRKSMAQIYEKVHKLISAEIMQGIPIQRILIGGFSMGGVLALHTGYHLNTDVAGVFACSSFLQRDSMVYESLRKHKETTTDMLPELRMFHGDRDTIVPLEWSKESFDKLTQLGVRGTYTPLKDTLHELKKRQLLELEQWILAKLPPLSDELKQKL